MPVDMRLDTCLAVTALLAAAAAPAAAWVPHASSASALRPNAWRVLARASGGDGEGGGGGGEWKSAGSTSMANVFNTALVKQRTGEW